MGIFGEFLGQLGRGLGVGPAAVERVVPLPQADIVDEAHRASSSAIWRTRKLSGSQP